MFKESIALQPRWDRDKVRKELRRNLQHGRAFMVSSNEGDQRDVVRAYLSQYQIPYAFVDEADVPYRWKCLIGFLEPDGLTYFEGGGPPEVLTTGLLG